MVDHTAPGARISSARMIDPRSVILLPYNEHRDCLFTSAVRFLNNSRHSDSKAVYIFQLSKYGAIHLLFDSVSVLTVLVYTHGFRSLSAGFAGTLVIARTTDNGQRATGQRHAAVTGPSCAPLRDSRIAAGQDSVRPWHLRHSVRRFVGRSSGSCLHGRSSC